MAPHKTNGVIPIGRFQEILEIGLPGGVLPDVAPGFLGEILEMPLADIVTGRIVAGGTVPNFGQHLNVTVKDNIDDVLIRPRQFRGIFRCGIKEFSRIVALP